jgi:hypothetical protein
MSFRIPVRMVVLVCALLLALASPAAAATTPPGNSAVDQYTETYPTAQGGEGTGPKQGGDPSRALGNQTAQQFAAEGPDGRAAANLAAATAPRAGQRPAPAGGSVDSGSDDLPGPLGALEHTLGSSDSDGTSLLLPLILAGTLLAATAYLLARRRRVS